MNVSRRIGIGINIGRGPAWVARTVVFIPGNGAIYIGSRNNVEVAIPVHVGHMNIPGTIGTGRDIGGGPARVTRPVVLVPGNGVVIDGGRNNVEVAIAIHVGHMNIEGAIGTGRDIGRGPAGVRRPVVLVPGNGVVIPRGRNNVEVAIPVHVGDMNVSRPISIGGDIGRGERERIIGARVIDRDGLAGGRRQSGRKG